MNRNESMTHKWIGGPTQSAFSLVELMVAMAIISVLATVSAAVFKTTLDTREIAERKIQINEVARTALDLMSEEIRTAYLAPESVAPVLQGNEAVPRLRFAGIHNDSNLDSDSPGAGLDDDGDEKTDGDDEASLNGIDDDGDGFVDEDYGDYPDDVLHFVRLIESEGNTLALEEVSYGLNKRGTRLVRRGRRFEPSDLQSSNTNNRIGSFRESNISLLPNLIANITQDGFPVMQTSRVSGGQYTAIWDNVTDDEAGNLSSNMATLAYDIRGLRFTYWYYDYNRSAYRSAFEWDSSRETCLVAPTANIFTQAPVSDRNAASASLDIEIYQRQGKLKYPFHICNEAADMLPRTRVGTVLQFGYQSYSDLLNTAGSQEEAATVSRKVGAKSDGLPLFVEITVYVQDRDQILAPAPYTTRVYLPNQNVGA